MYVAVDAPSLIVIRAEGELSNRRSNEEVFGGDGVSGEQGGWKLKTGECDG